MIRKCQTPYCRNNAEKGRKICSKCKMRIYAKKHPLRYTFNNLRCNAKRRGKSFNLTFDEFIEFCEETNYMGLKGKTSSSMSIDRDKDVVGYEKGNLHAMPLGENVKKQRRREYLLKSKGYTVEGIKIDLEECPF